MGFQIQNIGVVMRKKSPLTKTVFAYIKPTNYSYISKNWAKWGYSSKSQFIDSLIDKYRKEIHASNTQQSK